MKLNLGSGNDYRKGYVNVDRVKMPKVDFVHDLNDLPLPFKDNSAEEIRLIHVLEHLKKQSLKKFFDELYRICKPNGLIFIEVPYFFSAYSVIDLEHENFFVWDTLFQYCSEELHSYYHSKAKFEIVERKFGMLSNVPVWRELLPFFANAFPRFYERFFARIFPCDVIKYVLRPKKVRGKK